MFLEKSSRSKNVVKPVPKCTQNTTLWQKRFSGVGFSEISENLQNLRLIFYVHKAYYNGKNLLCFEPQKKVPTDGKIYFLKI